MAPLYNFASGPARLPDAVLEKARETLFARGADGASALERPFTSAAFRATLERARQRLAALLGLPEGYRVLFLAGGAMQQFSMVPLNLLGDSRRAAYADSGYWAGRAIAEARRYAEVAVVARYEGATPLAAPPLDDWRLPADCAYCHITPNETGEGIAYPGLPDTGAVPLVADATSCFLSGPLDVSRFGLIYAGAQKNIGPAGLTVVIVREDLLEREARHAPAPYRYRQQVDENNTVNTPVGWAIELAALVFDWITESGGLAAMAAANRAKAAQLYRAIDTSGGFYRAPVVPAHRSPSNVRFQLADERLTEPFLQQAEAAGLTHLRGHCHVGGLRASLYNAMPAAGVSALVEFMTDFARRQG
ncbi:3-phosphoserine/phosphohydroxythreonine transaminase [Pseudogulbenkiania sp. MAI-1]|uniref:3-phosphoserine/phosphohydroxythreonine transaminase n=1 Tax=Pseudogulbenkiania sp. MAI-1 TaxID=990370 RepID=UPI00045EA3C5|nr:3-phosphoserine/phosphohydroxythreonine transaminase [Pseudogulbenkiania sp. MAI-1]